MAKMRSYAVLPHSLPPAERRGYSNVFNALVRISREEGITTLWRVCIWRHSSVYDAVLVHTLECVRDTE